MFKSLISVLFTLNASCTPRDFVYDEITKNSKNLRKPFRILFVKSYTLINLSGPVLNAFSINYFVIS